MNALHRFLVCVFAMFCATTISLSARADETSDAILGEGRNDLHLESIDMQVAGFSQRGHGYQSQAGPRGGPGSEALEVFEPQMLFVVKQGPKLTYRLAVPLDIVTAASPNAMDQTPASADIVSQASRQNEAGSLDGSVTYDVNKRTSATLKGGFHLEEDFRSFNLGMAGTRTFRDDNTTLAFGGNEIYDWFDNLDYTGRRHGRTQRGTTSGFASVTQILSPTTVAYLNYGITDQEGTLGNTWNAVPIKTAKYGYGGEILPDHRLRHALVFRVAQWLPWDGAVKGFYRFYADDWGIAAHTFEVQLLQRISPWLYVQGSYRFHTQTGAYFFTTSAIDDGSFRTADSDLQSLDAQSLGFLVNLNVPTKSLRGLEFGAGYERYFRTNDLQVNVAVWKTGFRF